MGYYLFMRKRGRLETHVSVSVDKSTLRHVVRIHYKRKKKLLWEQRYVILSKGCLYIYKNKNSKKPIESFSLKHFEYVRESEPENGENICFCLHYRKGKPPRLFACDTHETREEWIKKLRLEMSHVQSTFYLSADSEYGSAGTVPAFRESDIYETAELDEDDRKYDKVDERRFDKAFQPDKKDTQAQRNIKHKLYSEDNDYEPINCPREPDACKREIDIKPSIQGSYEVLGAVEKKGQIITKPKIYMEELISKLNSDHRGLSSVVGKDTQAKTPLLRRDSSGSVASSFVSVQGGDEQSDNVISISSQPIVQTQGNKEGQTQQKVKHESHSEESDADCENLTDLFSSSICDREKCTELANQGLSGGIKKTEHLETKPNSFLGELQSKIKTGHMGLAIERGKSTKVPTSTTFRRHSMTSVTSSFLSIREEDDISDNVLSQYK
ncbi:uncharacterized protein LOC123524173 isoform X2 [Mercenaria mercenaria]|uniref:uncharacterized protein LOC123524173 isoform X2 n=1 Tax=Mercenaria mercenaria TaxID=6596 RepID=UPI00234ED560|nr:uncharacterized protein LOC123524173 isoform X2 [Mercenaria mercenaria]